MDEIKVGDYIYDISTNIGGYQVNQYKVLYIDDKYIYCVNNKGIKGRFNKLESVLYKKINDAKDKAHRLFQEKKNKENKIKNAKTIREIRLENLKKSFYKNLNNKKKKSIFNHIETDLESKVRNSQIQEIKDKALFNPTPKPAYNTSQNIKTKFPYNYGRDWRYDSPKLVSPRQKKLRPSVPYKVLPNGAIVSINKNDRD